MNSKNRSKSENIILATIGLLLSCNVLGEIIPITYEYGLKPDVVKVLSISTEYTPICEPVDHIMKYIDSSGETRALKYRALSDACSSRG
ncbi:DUF2790 domain-containing protein [Pseudomonas sp. OIL-1]|uniref:DUF2790 domain-containing protein n=1 Tax=Pseudomonas sp. OIL-1 TaxID=2706126 RepID=UPI0013A7B5C1|nr:DUF2790 domain-containing protein [Pseudomonas sp. OIL-1]QIB52339.1 DUF2790 domain-containing protein [Pseudomonas sp. OIL-1]